MTSAFFVGSWLGLARLGSAWLFVGICFREIGFCVLSLSRRSGAAALWLCAAALRFGAASLHRARLNQLIGEVCIGAVDVFSFSLFGVFF